MIDIVHPLIDAYAQTYTSTSNNHLWQVHQQTLATHAHKHMLSSWVQGQFLSFISQIKQPKYILEIGTFTGFSALCLAQGLAQNGELHTIEIREPDAQQAQINFNNSNFKNQIHLHIANAKQKIETLHQKWDLIFIDADKTSYIDYYNLCINKLDNDGLMIVDNVLFHGKVLQNTIDNKSAVAIAAFNKHVANDANTQQVLLTIRDGIMLIKKNKNIDT
jgi:caffeoyl-CoA O-methyltransferase